MTRQQLDRFFTTLAREYDGSVRVILTGAAAGSITGPLRPSLDVDFGVELPRRTASRWQALTEAIERTVRLTGIPAQYAEDIDRWGAISLLDYRAHTTPYRRFGKVRVDVLDPAYWSIGKLTRYLDPDVFDMVAVLKRTRVPVVRLVRLWGRALRASPRSMACTEFRTHAEHFLQTHGRRIWGTPFDANRAIAAFHRAAGVR